MLVVLRHCRGRSQHDEADSDGATSIRHESPLLCIRNQSDPDVGKQQSYDDRFLVQRQDRRKGGAHPRSARRHTRQIGFDQPAQRSWSIVASRSKTSFDRSA